MWSSSSSSRGHDWGLSEKVPHKWKCSKCRGEVFDEGVPSDNRYIVDDDLNLNTCEELTIRKTMEE